MNIYTTNGCYFTPLKVLPKNWKKRSSIRKGEKWQIYYRFYDPTTQNNSHLWGKLFRIKGMNVTNDAKERIAITEQLINKETQMLQNFWNPVFAKFMVASAEEKKSRFTVQDALWYGFDKLECTRHVQVDIKSKITGFINAAKLVYDYERFSPVNELPIKELSLTKIYQVLDKCYEINPRFTDATYNKYRAYLSHVFKKLKRYEVIDHNLMLDVETKRTIKKIRKTLTIEEEQLMNEHLYQKDYYFWRFMQIFYYADARETELMKIRNDGTVNIAQQEFIVEIIKGKQRREELKQISNEVVHLWKEIIEEAKPGDYLFSKGLKPGPNAIRPDQIGRRWKRLVKSPISKGGLGINKDFRSLNHSHITKVSTALGIKAAAESRGHTTPVITMSVYDVTRKQRLLDEVKNSGVALGK